MDNAAEPVTGFIAGQVQKAAEEERTCFVSPQKHTGKLRAAAGFLAFVLGVSLVLGSLGGAVGRLSMQRGSGEWWKSDWQETDVFRAEVSAYLREFLTLAAGKELNWYNGWYETGVWEGAVIFQEAIATDWGTTYTTENAATPALDGNDPDYWYKGDSNVLYYIANETAHYRNTEDTLSLSAYSRLPEGYNFMLTFQRGKITVIKDGNTLDIYGDGIYDEDSDWFLPGYDNFPVGDGVEDVYVYMAVRETPIQYYFTSSSGIQNSRMYWVYSSLQESREFYFRQAVLLGAGILCLAAWFPLRRERKLVGEKLASWTVHVWTEVRFLAVVLALACLFMPWARSAIGEMVREIWWVVWYSDTFTNALPYIAKALLACLENTKALLCLFWVLWLIHNDHRYNAKAERRSLWRLISLRTRKYPFQKRTVWRNRTAAVLTCLLPAAGVVMSVSLGISPAHWLFYVLVAFPAAVMVLIWLVLWKNAALARDVGLLADQVKAIRGGDLSTPLNLPEDADLRQTAEALNDIQAGLNRALAEQTRSERMKVELISNVSHDLKTPLTSILSYAELLRQEPLEGAAADYARIIDEKAHRLSAMVQDVFEVSKAAADQLPVNPERLDLAKLIRQTLADMDDPIRASRLTFRIDLPDEPVMIVADGKRLYRVFQNLIQNALQYALEGSRVYLSLKTGEGRAEASLRNTSRSELPEGVDFTARFVRGDESRTDGGSGLGLSIASSFTEACGGAFRVETVADLFTAVVTFPLAEG